MKYSPLFISSSLKKEFNKRSSELSRISALQSLAELNKKAAQAALSTSASGLPVYTGQPPEPLQHQQSLFMSSPAAYTVQTNLSGVNQEFTGSPPSIPLLSHDGNIKDAAFTS